MGKQKYNSTFHNNSKLPIYDWFYFNEGFSKDYVLEYLEKYSPSNVLDPFCGTGTTLLTCKEKGIHATGSDVSPLMYLYSKAKTNDYNINEIETIVGVLILEAKEIQLNTPKSWIKKFFYSDNLNDLYRLRSVIEEMQGVNRELFLSVLIKTLEDVSLSLKQGASIRKVKKSRKDVFKIFLRNTKRFVKDIKRFEKQAKDSVIDVHLGSGLDIMPKLEENYDMIITSPPYLNKTEYTKRMGIELEFLGEVSILKNHLGTKEYNDDKFLYEKYFEKIGELEYKLDDKNYNIHNYFKSLEIFVSKAKEKLSKDGKLIIVIAGGCFKNRAVDIYDYMQELYSCNSLEIIDIKIERELTCHKNRTEKIGKIKEFSIVGRNL